MASRTKRVEFAQPVVSISLKPSIQKSASDVFVIVPAFNEGAVIQSCVMQLLTTGYSVVVVDDGSTDNTYKQSCQLPIHVIRHPINLGQGAALQTGTTYALDLGATAIVHFDGDGQHDSKALDRLLKPIFSGEVDVVLGSRFKNKIYADQVPKLKKIVLKCATKFTGFTTGMWLTDSHNGFRAFSARAAKQIKISQPRMAHASEIISLIGKQKLSYAEIPISVQYTEYSTSKGQSIWNSVNIIIDLFLKAVLR